MAVFAVHQLTVTVNNTGSTYSEIKDIENADISISGNVEEWTSLDNDGFISRLRTGVGVEISFSGKRNFGDAGNDYIAGLAFAVGTAANTTIKILTNETVPKTFTIPCVIDVSAMLGGDATSVGALEWTAMSNGAITVA